VRIIAVSALKAFLARSPAYAEAHDPIMAWVRQVKAADWANPAELKREARSASILKDGRAVFNVAGNKYRIVDQLSVSDCVHSFCRHARTIRLHQRTDDLV
jgi:mRNA interferase HigB